MARHPRQDRRRRAVDRDDTGSRTLPGWRRKNDVIDAAAAARIAALRGDANPVVAEAPTTVLALLDEHRDNAITQRTRLINQLHALLHDLTLGAPQPISLPRRVQTAGHRTCSRARRSRWQAAGPRAAGRNPRRRPTAQDADEQDRDHCHRTRQPAADRRWDQAGHGGPAAGTHPPGQPIRQRISVCQLRTRAQNN
jgi:hypothetical protein